MAEFARLVDESGMKEESLFARLVEKIADLAGNPYNDRLPEPFRPLRAHVETIAQRVENEIPEKAGRLWNTLAGYFLTIAEYAQARSISERALAIDERGFGPDHQQVATDLAYLELVLKALGDFAGAKASLERALRIDEQVYGPEHPEVAAVANNLGTVLQDLGDFAGAKASLERALRIDEQVYGPEHPEVATDANNLG
ncbi:MAG: tetratricopeptide repeat protein, partial [Anaerolineaceae bacterium]|nr:tetratricopeptide repeat protein [Anaerolineaceae bacterium]